jgi:hypothetical protein
MVAKSLKSNFILFIQAQISFEFFQVPDFKSTTSSQELQKIEKEKLAKK